MSKTRLQNTDQDIMYQLMLNNIALTHDSSLLLIENGLHPLNFSWMNSICDLVAIKQH